MNGRKGKGKVEGRNEMKKGRQLKRRRRRREKKRLRPVFLFLSDWKKSIIMCLNFMLAYDMSIQPKYLQFIQNPTLIFVTSRLSKQPNNISTLNLYTHYYKIYYKVF